MIVGICSIALLDAREGDATSSMAAVLVDGAGAELLVAMVGEFTMTTVLVKGGATELLSGCVDGIGGLSCSAIRLVSHAEAALVVELVGAGLLGAGPSVALGTRLLSSVVFPASHARAASAIAAVLALFDLSACPVAMFAPWVDFCTTFAALAATSRLEAWGLGSTIFPDLVSVIVEVCVIESCVSGKL